METFIVRIWTPAPDLAYEVEREELHGNLEHVGSRHSESFRTTEELLELLRSIPDPAARPPARP